jgi:hypothetical protein
VLAHNVFFSLRDNSSTAVAALLADCHRYLVDHPGVVFYGAGTASDIDRPVSDRAYDVALCVVFADRAAHDVYQASPPHQEFIARNKANWQQVRVFDAMVDAPSK